MAGSRKSIIRSIEAFFTKTDFKKKTQNASAWPPELVSSIQEYINSHSFGDADSSSYSTKIHEDLLHLQKVARENDVPEACFLQALVLFAPALVNRDQLQEWFKAYAGPAINSAGHLVESVEASRSFLLAVLDRGVYPLCKTANSSTDSHSTLSASASSSSNLPEDVQKSLDSNSNSVPSTSSSLLDKNPALSPLIKPTAPVCQSNIALSTLPSSTTPYSEESTPSALYFSWILDTYLCINLDTWFSFKESGLTLEERMRVLVKNSRDLLLKWSSHNEKSFFQRLDFYRTQDPKYRQLNFSLLSLFISRNPTSNIEAICETNLLNTLLNSLLYDSLLIVLNIGSKVLGMIIPYISAKLTKEVIFKLFLIYGRLACCNSFRYDFSLPKFAQKTLDTSDSHPATESKHLAVEENLPKLSVPKGWKLISKAFDLPEVELVDVAPLFTVLYGLWPFNFLAYIREPTQFITQRTDTSNEKEGYVVPFPEGWTESWITDRSQQMFYSHSINPLLVRGTIEDELKPGSTTALGSPVQVATFCNSLRERFGDVLPQSRRQSSFTARNQQAKRGSVSTGHHYMQKNSQPQSAQNNYDEPYLASLFESETLMDNSDLEIPPVDLDENGERSTEIPLIASPIVYRRSSGSWSTTPRIGFSEMSIKDSDELMEEHKKLFTKYEQKGKNAPYGSDLVFDNFSLNDTAPSASSTKAKAMSNARIPSSFLSYGSPSGTNGRANSKNIQLSPLSSPRTVSDIMSSPMLVGQSAPMSSVTHVVVNSPPVISTNNGGSGNTSSSSPLNPAEPDTIRLSPKSTNTSSSAGTNSGNLVPSSSSAAITSVLSDTLQTARGSPRLAVINNPYSSTPPFAPHGSSLKNQTVSAKTTLPSTQNSKPLNNRSSNSADTSTSFYHREFSILRNEYDFILFCEFHSRTELCQLQKSRLTDLALLQTLDQLSLANQALHSRLGELTVRVKNLEAELIVVRTKQRESEHSASDRKLAFQNKIEDLEKELQLLKTKHGDLEVSHSDLLALAVKKEEKLSYLELRVDELSKEKELADNYKKALAVVEQEKNQLAKKTENHISLEEAYATENLLTKFKELSSAKIAAEQAKEKSDLQHKIQINSLQAMLRDAQQQMGKPSKSWLENYEGYIRETKLENEQIKTAFAELSKQYEASVEVLSNFYTTKEAKANAAKGLKRMQRTGSDSNSASGVLGAGGNSGGVATPDTEMVPMFEYIESDLNPNGGSSANSLRSGSAPQQHQTGAISPTHLHYQPQQHHNALNTMNMIGNESGVSTVDPSHLVKRQPGLGSSASASTPHINRARGRGGVQNSGHGANPGATRSYRNVM